MPLALRARIGAYEIVAAIGAGGMGEVYRARDTKLNRDVAIKVIPEPFASDPDRLGRFEREAQLLAALNHPNIAHVYGLESQPPLFCIAMELVEGEELAARIARGALPLDEALPIAAQIADALEAAHEQGIIHRDLKPANIKITADGRVKVLDFGLAKAMDPASAANASATVSPTISMHATQAGVILGTAAYMSPEQARGRPVDKRADIWAFGVVLYEMVTGRKPFHGEDVGEVLAGVIKEQPSWDAVPAPLRRLVKRCLEKDPKKRLRDITGVALLLDDAPPTAPGLRSAALPWIVAGTLGVAAALALWAPWRASRVDMRPLIRLDVDLGADAAIAAAVVTPATDAIISPDGNRLVWVSRNRIFTRRLDQEKTVQLATSSVSPAPFFSDDGQWVAFSDLGKLRKVSVEGGSAITLCDTPQLRGGTWTPDGTIIASLDGAVLSTVPAAGGAPAPLTQLTGLDAMHRWPHMLPGGRALLFTSRSRAASYDEANIEVLSLRDRHRTIVVRGGTFGRYLPAPGGRGYLVYINRGTLFAVRFDVDELKTVGTPSPVLEDIGYNNVNGAAQFDASRTGTVVYRSGVAGGLISLRWLDAGGRTDPLPVKPGVYNQPRLSPDGKLLALSVSGASGVDIWVYDWQRDAMSRLTSGGASYVFPVWSPDGRYLVFTAGFGGRGIFWTRADGASKPQLLVESTNALFPWSFSPDGTRLAYAQFTGPALGDIWTVPVKNEHGALTAAAPEPYLRSPASELFPAFSPDGRWIAYRTLDSGTSEIEVRRFPDNGGKWLISNNGGEVPVWAPNGRQLFYRTDDQRIMVVDYTTNGDVFVPEKPRVWSDKRLAAMQGRNLDIAPDGKRFVVMMPTDTGEEQKSQSHVTFLQNFPDDIERRLGTAK